MLRRKALQYLVVPKLARMERPSMLKPSTTWMHALASSLCAKVMYALADAARGSDPPPLWLRFTTTLTILPYCPK
jgi:hypothetical protein